MEFPKAARNLLRCVDMYAAALREHPGRVRELVELPGDKLESYQLTDDLSMDVVCGEPALYPRQKEVYDGAFRGERDRYALMHWGKCMNVASLRQRLHYHGKEIVLGGDAYAVVWDNDTLAPCDILKVPHHACLSSTTRKMVDMLRPKTAVVSVAARLPGRDPAGVRLRPVRRVLPESDRRNLPHHSLLQEPGQRPLRRHQGRQVRGQSRHGMRLGADLSASEGPGPSGRSEMPHAAARLQYRRGYQGRQRI